MFPRVCFILCTLLSFNVLLSQKETSNWLFGDRNWLSFSPLIQTKDSCNTYFEEPASSMSDKNGNLIFYSDGNSVFNKYHRLIKNGDNLLGHWSASEGCVFVQKPGNDSVYYLFTNDYALQSNGFRYNVIRLHSNPDSSEIIEKNIQIGTKMCESISVINHQNGLYKWIVVHSGISNTIYAFLLTDKGLNLCPVETSIGYAFNGAVLSYQTKGKFNNDGTLWAIDDFKTDIIKLCSFDNFTGVFSNPTTLTGFDIISGIQFSKSSKYMYVVERHLQLTQVNLKTLQKKRIFDISQTGGRMSKCQYGIDGKIYLYWGDSSILSSIDNPEGDGPACNFNLRSVTLKHKCTSGLPNFDQSYFYTPSIDFNYRLDCDSDSFQFIGKDTISATTFKWQIGKSNQPLEVTKSSKKFSYVFSDTGKYHVIYVASNNFRSDTIIKSIVVYPKVRKDFLGKDTVYAKGTVFNKLLKAPWGAHCQLWQDSITFSSYSVDTAGVYICKATTLSFCEVTDTIVILECINSLSIPSFYRSGDTLFANQPLADSFVWYRNAEVYRVTKENFIRLTDTGHYRVEAAKKGHCNRSSSTNWVNKLAVKTLLSSDLNLWIYPNPSQGTVFISCDHDFELLISDITGRIIESTSNVDQVKLKSGVYFFNFIVNGYKGTQKVVIY